jgi:hypothetical protein
MDEREAFPSEGDGIPDDYCVLHQKRPLVLPRTKIAPPFIAIQATISTGFIMADTQYATCRRAGELNFYLVSGGKV